VTGGHDVETRRDGTGPVFLTMMVHNCSLSSQIVTGLSSPDDLFGASQQKARELIIALRTLIGERDQKRKLASSGYYPL